MKNIFVVLIFTGFFCSCGGIPKIENITCEKMRKIEKIPFIKKGMKIIYQTKPHPGWLRYARIDGRVILEVLIDKEGNVRRACVKWGHPILNSFAIKSVLEWKFKPYLLNGKPSIVRCVVFVPFKLNDCR